MFEVWNRNNKLQALPMTIMATTRKQLPFFSMRITEIQLRAIDIKSVVLNTKMLRYSR